MKEKFRYVRDKLIDLKVKSFLELKKDVCVLDLKYLLNVNKGILN